MAISENEPGLEEIDVEGENTRTLGLSAYEQKLQLGRGNLQNKAPLIGATAYEQAMARQKRSAGIKTVVAISSEASKDGNR